MPRADADREEADEHAGVEHRPNGWSHHRTRARIPGIVMPSPGVGQAARHCERDQAVDSSLAFRFVKNSVVLGIGLHDGGGGGVGQRGIF
jgi:hypothetical protein